MSSPILETLPLGFPWVTADPFLFCVHHDDRYPAGDDRMAPDAKELAGRQIGQDFAGKDGWRMYHGETVPGFPGHPHRGFETVTIVRRGHIDHSDSLGAAARFGSGDTQWLTAGAGIVHSEMFPLIEREKPNHLELFQIWLNLPSADKMVDPHFTMLWSKDVPIVKAVDAQQRVTEVMVVAGELDGKRAPPPPPNSWAARPDTDVAIWSIAMEAGATWTLPPTKNPEAVRVLYFFGGPSLKVGGELVAAHAGLVVKSDEPVVLEAGAGEVDILLLQGRPIGEPVVQHGPFVMNEREEIQRAMQDYQRTRFGGWPWPSDDPVHARDAGRFAKHADGRVEKIE
ncbi:MAG TPA: pirin family protein [Labilithrix sp.]|nr:pirin family protein [Labilithrix sp.]